MLKIENYFIYILCKYKSNKNMSYTRMIDMETTPLLRNRFKPTRITKIEKIEIVVIDEPIKESKSMMCRLIENAKKNARDKNSKSDAVITYLLENIKINTTCISFDNSISHFKNTIFSLCDNCDIFDMKNIKDYIARAYNIVDKSVFSDTHIELINNTEIYIIFNLFMYINYMIKGCRYNYHNYNNICFTFDKLKISDEVIAKLKKGDIVEIVNLFLHLLSYDDCVFGVNESAIDIDTIEIL